MIGKLQEEWRENAPGDSAMKPGEGVKCLSFVRCGKEYAVEISRVRKVVGLMDEVQMPVLSHGGYGITDVLGDELRVVDPCGKCECEQKFTNDMCILVVGGKTSQFGLITDRLSDVLKMTGDTADVEDTEPWLKSVQMTDAMDRSKAVRLVDPDMLYESKLRERGD